MKTRKKSRRSPTPSPTSKAKSPGDRGLQPLAKKIGIKDLHLLRQALTHPSSTSTTEALKNNQRLEFLGDAVLGLFIARFLYDAFPSFKEGELAKMKSFLISQKVLAEKAAKLKLDGYLILGEGEERTGGRGKPSLLADAFEALLGALYLDQGEQAVVAFLKKTFSQDLPKLVSVENFSDYKSTLQERTQRQFGCLPTYKVVEKSGPPHAPTFAVEVWADGEKLGEGKGSSKKEAEQSAAQMALKRLRKP